MDQRTLINKLGRKAQPDQRDQGYLIKDHLKLPKTALVQRNWDPNGWWGDQGDSPMCVGYAWAHWISDGPVTHRGVQPVLGPGQIYEQAKLVDEWQGENYDGTSVRGGVKYLKTAGWVKSYYWAFDVNVMARYILTTGPMVMGTDWYTGMFTPHPVTGVIRATGAIAGGHAYVVNGVNMVTRQFRMKNSWGRSWGKGGMAWITFNDMKKLLMNQGEACVAVETPDSQLIFK